jgi:hypothetical protein
MAKATISKRPANFTLVVNLSEREVDQLRKFTLAARGKTLTLEDGQKFRVMVDGPIGTIAESLLRAAELS